MPLAALLPLFTRVCVDLLASRSVQLRTPSSDNLSGRQDVVDHARRLPCEGQQLVCGTPPLSFSPSFARETLCNAMTSDLRRNRFTATRLTDGALQNVGGVITDT
jgi:hypothetical protein